LLQQEHRERNGSRQNNEGGADAQVVATTMKGTH